MPAAILQRTIFSRPY